MNCDLVTGAGTGLVGDDAKGGGEAAGKVCSCGVVDLFRKSHKICIGGIDRDIFRRANPSG